MKYQIPADPMNSNKRFTQMKSYNKNIYKVLCLMYNIKESIFKCILFF